MLARNMFGNNRQHGKKNSDARPAKGRRAKKGDRGRTLRVEGLEDRRMLAVFVVRNLLEDVDDNGDPLPGTLRQAVQLANADDDLDQIIFDDDAFFYIDGEPTITSTFLNGGQIEITQPVQILGPGALDPFTGKGKLEVVADVNSRIFDINIGDDDEAFTVEISGMTLTGGNIVGNDNAGAVWNRENLTMTEVILSGNSAEGGGGAVFTEFGSLDLRRSLVTGNTAAVGGGILNGFDNDDDGRPLTNITDSTLVGNSAVGNPEIDLPADGGGAANRNGTLRIANSTITGNSSGSGAVATYGIDFDPNEDDPFPLVVADFFANANTTFITHSIIIDNNGGDLFGRTFEVGNADSFLLPRMLINNYNIIGDIVGTTFWGPADDGNSSYYQIVSPGDDLTLSWTYANFMAQQMGGHLATITSAEEDAFVAGLLNPGHWVTYEPMFIPEPNPAPDPPIMWNVGPWLGGVQAMPAGPAGGWQWLGIQPPEANRPAPDLEEWDYTNWAAGQPDDGLIVDANAMIEQDRLAYLDPNNAFAPTWGDFVDLPEDDERPIAFVLEYSQQFDLHNFDPILLPLNLHGGSTPTFYPNNPEDPDSLVRSPAIDMGAPGLAVGDEYPFQVVDLPFPALTVSVHDQRGRHFTRQSSGIDIGAVEVQNGLFFVDALVDETDGQYSQIWEEGPTTLGVPTFTFFGYDAASVGDFALREAIEFADANPEFDTIRFSTNLQILEDLTPSNAPTILLTKRSDVRSALVLQSPLAIEGPASFEVEIDASGTDLDPGIDSGGGARVFRVDDGDIVNDISVTIDRVTLLGGDVVGNGGAIFSMEDLAVNRATIKGNASTADGGAIYSQVGSLVVDSSTFNDNFAANEGGALFFDTDVPGDVLTGEVRNTTISGNQAANRGGAIFNKNAEVRISNSTITLNAANSTRASGVGSANGADALTLIQSSIISDNEFSDVELLQGATNITSLGFNLIGTGNANVLFNQPGDLVGIMDPMLAPLARNGGPTPTHRLEAGSPAIDAGDTAAAAGVDGIPEFDQRGFPFTRVFDGVFDDKDRIDIGAYELQSNTFLVDTLFDENNGLIGVGNFSLREAIEASNDNPLPDTIMFDPGLLGGTISQGFGFLQPDTPVDMRITDSVSIIGLGETFLTIDGSGAIQQFPDGTFNPTRLFTIDDSDPTKEIEVSISDITLQNNANSVLPGATILSVEDLTLTRISIFGSSTFGAGVHGGAIFQQGASITLDDTTLAGNGTSGVNADGGGLYAVDADVSMINGASITGGLVGNAHGTGGGAYIRGGALTMIDSSITGNKAPGGNADGAGLWLGDAEAQIIDSVISGNSMTGSNSEGGGAYITNSVVEMTGVIVTNNYTTGTQSEGAGLYISGGQTSISGGFIAGNTTGGDGSDGAGVFISSGVIDISNSRVRENETTGPLASGGGIVNDGGELTIRDSEVSHNSVFGASASGGGIWNGTSLGGNSFTRIVNSTVSNNSAAVRGGGVFNDVGLVELLHSTVADNSVPTNNSGAGVASAGSPATTITRLGSTLVVGNHATGPGVTSDLDSVGPGVSVTLESRGYNVVGFGDSLGAFDAAGDQTMVTGDLLGPLLFNGGTTQTHVLLEGSPAINAGDPSFDLTDFDPPMNFDQRGDTFDRVSQGVIDVGAVESNFVLFGPADFNDDAFTDGIDLLAWQRGYGSASGAAKTDGDANDDGVVNEIDLDIWETAFGSASSAESAAVLSSSSSSAAAVAGASSFSEENVVVSRAEPGNERAQDLQPTFFAMSDATESRQRDRSYSAPTREQLDADATLLARDRGFQAIASSNGLASLTMEDRAAGANAEAATDESVDRAVFDELDLRSPWNSI